MAQKKSVSQIVKKVIEDLSEGVSDLVLTVVVLAEQNVGLPSEISSSATAVNETALTLGKIARQLANTNYKAHQEIAREIEEAASAVDNAVVILTKAINAIRSGSDRKAGWNGLIDACRTMSGKTIRLLQIVYGADLKRLQLSSLNLRNDLQNINIDEITSNPQKFVKDASDAGTKLTQVSNYLKNRSNEAESDLAKEKLKEDSEKLYKEAQDFIGTVNQALNNPKDPNKRKNLEEMIKKMKDDIEEATNYATDVSPEASKLVSQPTSSPDISAPHEAYHELKNMIQNNHDLSDPSNISPLDDQLNRARDAMDNLEVSALGNPSLFVNSAKAAKQELEQLKSDAKKYIDDHQNFQSHDPDSELAREFENISSKADRAFNEQLLAAKKVAQEPNNPDAKLILDMKTQDMKDVLDDLEDLTIDKDSLNNNIDDLVKVMDEILLNAGDDDVIPPDDDFGPRREVGRSRVIGHSTPAMRNPSIAKPDAKKGKKQLSDLVDIATNLTEKIKYQGAYQASKCRNIDEQEEILNTIAILDDDLNRLKEDINNSDTSKLRDDASSVSNSLKQIKEKTHAESIDTIEEMKRAAQDVAHDAKRGEDDELLLDVQNLNNLADNLGRKISDFKNSLDPSDPRQNELDQLKEKMFADEEELANIAYDLAQDPNNERLRNRVDKALDKLDDVLEDMEDLVKNREPEKPVSSTPLHNIISGAKKAIHDVEDAAEKGNAQDLVGKSQEEKKAIDNLKDKARKMIPEAHENRRKEIEEAISGVEKAFPGQLVAAQKLMKSPGDPLLKKALKDASVNLEEALETLAVTTSDPTLEEALDLMSNFGDELIKDINSGNKKHQEELLQDLNNLNDKVQEIGKYHMRITPDQEEKEDLKEILEILDDVVKDICSDVHSGKSPDQIEKDINELNKIIDTVRDITHAKALDDIEALRRETLLQDQAAERGDDQAWQPHADNIAQKSKELGHMLSALSKKMKDPIQKEKILHNAEELEAAIDKHTTASEALLRNPDAVSAHKALEDSDDHLRKIFNDLEDGLAHKISPGDEELLSKINNNKNLNESPIHKDIDKVKDNLNDLLEAVNSGNLAAIPPITGKIKNNLDDIEEKSKKILDESNNPEQQQDIEDILNAIHYSGFAPLVHATRGFLETEDDDSKKQVEEKAGILRDLLEDLEFATENSPLHENIETMNDILDQIADIVDEGTPHRESTRVRGLGKPSSAPATKKNPILSNPSAKIGKKELVELIDEASKMADLINDQASALGPTNQNRKQRKAIKNDLEDIDEVLGNIKEAIQGEEDVDLSNLAEDLAIAKNKLKDLEQNTHADLLSDISKVARTIDALDHAHDRNDDTGKKREADKLKSRAATLVNKVKHHAHNIPDDTDQKERVLDATETLEREVGDVVEQAIGAPRDDLSVDLLREALNELEDALMNKNTAPDPRDSQLKNDAEEAKDLIEKIPVKAKHDPNNLGAHRDKTEKKIADILEKSRAIAREEKNPAKRAAIEELIAETSKLTPELNRAINNYKEELPQTKNNLQKICDKLAGMVDDLVDATQKQGLSEAAQALMSALNGIKDKSQISKPSEKSTLIDTMDNSLRQVKDVANHLAQQNQDPYHKDRCLTAINDLHNSCEIVKNDVNTKSPQNVLEPHCEQAKDKLKNLVDLFHGTALDDIEKVEKAVRGLHHAAERGNKPRATAKSNDLKTKIPELTCKIREEEKNLPEDRRIALEDALAKLKDAVDREDKTADEVLRNPNNASEKKKLKNAASDAQDALRNMTDILLNRDPNQDPNAARYEDIDDSSDDVVSPVIYHRDLGLDDIVPPPDDDSPLVRDIERAKATGNAIRMGALKKNPQIVAANAKKGEKEILELAEKVRSLTEEVQDPKKKKAYTAANRRLEDAFPNLLHSAKEVLEHPDDPEAQNNLEEAETNLNKALDKVEQVTRQPDIYENALRLKKKLDNLTEAKRRRDPNDMADIMRDIRDLESKIVHQAHYIKQQHPNNEDKKNILEAIHKFQNDVQALDGVASINKTDPVFNKGVADVRLSLDRLLNATNTPILAALDNFNTILDDLRDSSEPSNIDIPSMQSAAIDLLPASEDLIRTITTNSKNMKDPAQLQSIQAATSELPFAVKNVLIPTKALLLNPADASAKKDLTSAIDDVGQIVSSIQAAVQNKDAVPQQKKNLDVKVDAVQRIIPKLNSGTQNLSNNPRDPRSKKQLIHLADRAGDKTEALKRVILSHNPLEQADEKKREIKLNVVNMVKAVDDSDNQKFQRSLKTLQKTLPEYTDLLKTATDDPQKKEEIMDAIKTAEKILPEVVDSGKAAFKDPSNLEKKNEFRNVAQRYNRALNRAGNKVVPKQDEKNVRDAGEELKRRIAAIRAANRAKRDFELNKNLETVKPIERVFLRSVQRRARQLPEETNDAMKELQELWRKFGIGARKGSSEKELDDIQQKLERSVNQVSAITGAENIAAVQDVEDTLDNLLYVAENNKHDQIRNIATDLTNKTKILEERGNKLSEPSQREKFNIAYGKINTPLKNILQRANETIKDPDNIEKKKQLKEAIDNIGAPLGDIKVALEPASRDRKVEAEIAHAKAALAEVIEVTRTGTPQDVSSAISRAKLRTDTAIAAADEVIKYEPETSEKRKTIENAVKSLLSTASKISSTQPTRDAVEHTNHVVSDTLDELLEAIKSDARDDVLTATAKASNRVTEITRDGHKLPSRVVIEEGSALSRDLGSLVGNIHDQEREKIKLTRPLLRVHHDPRDSRSIITDIRNVPQLPTTTRRLAPSGRVAHLVSAIDHIAHPPPPKPKPASLVAHRETSTKFEDVVDRVAFDIAKKVQELQLKEASMLSSQLSILATAARDGNRKNLIQQGRQVASTLKEFCIQLRDYASKIPKKNRHEYQIQDRLIRTAQGLENVGTQLRILTSVKAASVETDKDTDLSLNFIINEIGSAVTEGLTAIDITHKTIIKAK